MKDIVERLGKDWIDCEFNEVSDEAKAEIESLRQQLAEVKAENEALRKANLECVEYFNEAQKDLAEKSVEIERLSETCRDHGEIQSALCNQLAEKDAEIIKWQRRAWSEKSEHLASQLREQQLVKHITRFILEWDNSGSSGAWPVEALKHLRLAIKENQ